MKRYILTGAPGSGKTSIINLLRFKGITVATEAVSDIILKKQRQGMSQPWKSSEFIDDIILLQKKRELQIEVSAPKKVFFDRSPICTYALALYLNLKISSELKKEVERIVNNQTYENIVFFIENLGFCEKTDIRTISFDECLKFEQIHKYAYQKFGYKLLNITAASIEDRSQKILNFL